jgi:TonB family protein
MRKKSRISLKGDRIRSLAFISALATGLTCPVYGNAQTGDQRAVKNLVQPVMPELAKRLNITGTVRIEVTVAPDGSVRQTRVLGGSPVLAVEAERAARKTTFESGPRETTQVISFKF